MVEEVLILSPPNLFDPLAHNDDFPSLNPAHTVSRPLFLSYNGLISVHSQFFATYHRSGIIYGVHIRYVSLDQDHEFIGSGR